MATVLVTGGSGFIGSNLVEALSHTHSVFNLDLSEPRNPATHSHWIQGSVDDGEELNNLFRRIKPDIVYHLAARTDLSGKTVSEYRTNIRGTENVIEAGKAIGGVHTVYASSRLVFAIDYLPSHTFDYRPSTPYGQSKIEAEHVVRNRASEAGTWSMVRPTSIWGPWFATPYRDFFESVRNGTFVMTNGRNPTKSFGFVGNVVNQLIELGTRLQLEANSEVLWLTDHQPLNVNEWSKIIAEELGVRGPKSVPAWALKSAAKIGDAAKLVGWSQPPLTSFRLKNLWTDMVYDTTREVELFGEPTYSLREGVQMTAEWMKTN